MSHLPFVPGDARGEGVVGSLVALRHINVHAELGTVRHRLRNHHQIRPLAGEQGHVLVIGSVNVKSCSRESAGGRRRGPGTVGEGPLVGHATDGDRLDGHAVGHLPENNIHGGEQMIELHIYCRAFHAVGTDGLHRGQEIVLLRDGFRHRIGERRHGAVGLRLQIRHLTIVGREGKELRVIVAASVGP